MADKAHGAPATPMTMSTMPPAMENAIDVWTALLTRSGCLAP